MIRVRDLSMRLSSGGRPITILDGVSLEVKAGEFVAITGPSGSGKSTLLGLIAGLDQPTGGAIEVDGVDITRLAEDALAGFRRDRIGYVFQAYHLIPTLTAAENVAVPLELAGRGDALAESRALLADVGLAARAHHYPAQLSGGEQQRVALARAVSLRPALLLADEPTGNLDSATGAAIIELMLRLRRERGSTLLLVTHDPALASHADRIVSILDGRLVNGTNGHPGGGAVIRFPFAMAWRETRGGWRHFVGFFACVALGVAALTSVGTLAANVDRALSREARALMGGDLELRAMRPLDGDAAAAVAHLVRAGATATRVRELVGMAREPARGATLLVELKAVEPGYPLYGRLDLEPARPLDELLAGGGALVQRDLLDRLGVKVGDGILVGSAPVTIRGVIGKEPDAPVGFALGPRVLIGADTLEATGLVRFGSRVRYRTLLRLPEALGAREQREAIAREIADPAVRVTSFNEAQPGLRRFFTQMTTYLGLVGLVSLLVGGIGVASSVATFVRRQRPTIAILKCLGARSPLLVASYLVQTQVVALAGCAVGLALGTAVQPAIVRLVAGTLPIEVAVRPDPGTLVRAFAMGMLTALLCAIWPLLSVRTVRPSLLLRAEVEPAVGRRPWLAALPVAAGLAALVLWQAGSWTLAGIFAGASAAALALLLVLARAVSASVRRRPRIRGLAWRQGLANLARPGGQSTGVIIALGVGVMLLVSIALLEGSLVRQIDHEQRREAPSFFFIDIQPDQRDSFARVVGEAGGGAAPVLTPVVRSRLVAVNGQPVTRDMVKRRRGGAESDGAWYLRREYVLTYASELPPTNVLVQGHWWSAADGARPLVSVEEAAAKNLGLKLGDRLTFDVQGVPVEAEVTSVRRVDWQTLSTNFFMILSPGALEGAPGTWVATVRVPPDAESRLQAAVVTAFPNVTAIPVRDVMERVGTMLDQMSLAMRVMALFSIGTGLVVMLSALTATRYTRLRESVIWRTLGATRGVVARIFAVEYACLGAAAGLGGSVLAVALSWIVLRFVLEVPWTLILPPLALGVSLTVVMALAVGFLATFRLLGQKPLSVLRQE